MTSLLYLHGFCSSPASWKARLMGEAMAARGIGERFLCPALSPVPTLALATAESLITRARGAVTLVGSSLGGHYATCLAERHGLRAVLVNPAVIGRLDASRFLGEHANFHSGERFVFTAEHASQLAAQAVTRPDAERYWLLVEQGDEVLDYRHAVEHYAGCRQTILPGGDHSFTRFPGFISQILEFSGVRDGI